MSTNWLSDAVIYQIYPQSFYDTNGDGIGDLKGIEQKLDYIKSIGVDTIWLNPCFASSFFDAGYDVTDYYSIASRYGTNEDMAHLLDAATKRSMRIVLDFVPGHTSIEHPWFKESAKGADNEYSDCYIWKNREYELEKGPTEENYLKSFFPEQPALNYGYATIEESWQQGIDEYWPRRNRQELKNIMKFWFDMGVSGFRVDMASSLIKNDPGFRETNRLWNEIREWLGKEYPNAVLISEWSNPEEAVNAGFHLDFMIHFHKESYKSLFFNEIGTLKHDDGDCYFDEKGNGSPFYFINEYMEQKKITAGKGYISLPTANHDFQRLVCGRRTIDQVRPAWVFLMTQPGIPVIYYGDEIGMRFIENTLPKEGSTLVGITAPNGGAVEGERAGTRTPMQWDSSRNAGFSTAPPEALYLPLDPDPERPNVETEENNPDSLLNFVRKLIALRRVHPALGADSGIEFLNSGDICYPLVYRRYDETREFIVALNPTSFRNSFTLKGKSIEGTPLFYENVRLEQCAENNEISIVMERNSYFIAEVTLSN